MWLRLGGAGSPGAEGSSDIKNVSSPKLVPGSWRDGSVSQVSASKAQATISSILESWLLKNISFSL